MHIFIGVAWPYANGSLHLGHVAGSLLPPDIFARYHRMKGNKVLMVSGSDEHGTPITVSAEKLGITPQELVDKFHAEHVENLKQLGISFDLFFRTSSSNHKKVVQEIFLRLLEKGYIYKKSVNALYCENCKKFLPDRYVEGICPFCSFVSARGDQCDKCGKIYDAFELISPKCKHCNSTPIIKETEHFFFKLSAFNEKLLNYLKDKNYWKSNVITFTNNWLKQGLKDRAITRDLTWGVEIPLQNCEDKRIYVWFEAVIGYFSTSKEYSLKIKNENYWKEFWQNENSRHYYFLGKDNIPFHTIIFPAILIGYGNLQLPYDVPANEYLTLKGEHFSKSRGTAVWLPDCLQKYNADALRYYLSINMPDVRDTEFSWEEFFRKNNEELVATYGNFVHRVLTFTQKNFDFIPNCYELSELDKNAIMKIEEIYGNVENFIEKCEFKPAIKKVMELAHFGNEYLTKRQPWFLIKNNKNDCQTVLHVSLKMIKALAFLTYPFMPFQANKVWKYLGYEGEIEKQKWEDGKKELKVGQKLVSPLPLFSKIDIEKEISEKKVGEIEVKKISEIKDEKISKECLDADKLKEEKLAKLKEETRKREEELEKISKEKEVEKVGEKIETKQILELKEKEIEKPSEKISENFAEFEKLELRIGKILSVEEHPNADKLIVMKIDIGEIRTIVAGIKKWYSKEQLVGKKVVVVANLERAKLRGVVSEGMILAGEEGDVVSVVVPMEDVKEGERVV